MARGACFVCLKSVVVESQRKEFSNTSSTNDVPVQLYLKFINFASRYLKLPSHYVLEKCGVFCGPCEVRVKHILELYSELCDVELHLSSKLEELRELIHVSSEDRSGGAEVVRNFVAAKCLEKCEEIREQPSFHREDLSKYSSEELEDEKEIKLEVEIFSPQVEEEPDPLQNSQHSPLPSTSKSISNPNFICGGSLETFTVAEKDDEMKDPEEYEDEELEDNSDAHNEADESMSTSSGESEGSDSDLLDPCSEGNLSESVDSYASASSDSEISNKGTDDDEEDEPPRRTSPRRPLQKPRTSSTSVKRKSGRSKNANLEVGKFICQQCDNGYSTEQLLYSHLSHHEKKSKAKEKLCFLCFCAFGSEQTYLFHMKLKHNSNVTDTQPFVCDGKDCNVSFATKDELNEHLKAHHSDQLNHHCPVCEWGFINQEYLKLHELVHTSKKEEEGYPCPCCSTSLKDIPKLQQHYNQKHGSHLGEGFKCPNCDIVLAKEITLKNHLKKHEGNKNNITELLHLITPPPCSICGLPFLYLKYLDVHRKKVHNLGVECPTCHKLFFNRGAWFRHNDRVHNPAKQGALYPCPHCTTIYRNKCTLNDHIAIDHPDVYAGAEKHQCPHCESRFHRNIGLWKHVVECEKNPDKGKIKYSKFLQYKKTSEKGIVNKGVNKNRDGEGFVCHICGKLFGLLSSLKTHQVIHSGEQKCTCHLCPKTFSQKVLLISHLRKFHRKVKGEEFTPGEGVRQLRCICLFPSCGEVFATDTELRCHVEEQHVISESGGGSEAPKYICNLCGKKFSNQARLTRHNLVHTKDKLFNCHLCGKGFPYKASLKEHVLAMHRDNPNIEQPMFPCGQPNCDREFRSPAPRFSHLRRAHGVYTTKPRKSSNMQKQETTVSQS